MKGFLSEIKFIFFAVAPALALILASSLLILFTDRSETGKNIKNMVKLYKLAIAIYSDNLIAEESVKGIRDGLTEAGMNENDHYTLKIYSAAGDIAALNGIIDTIAAERFDLIFSVSTPSLQAAIKKIKKTPIVFSSTGDPIGAGAGKNFSEHLNNVTGICSLSDFTGMINLIREIVPNVKKIGTVFCPAEINSVLYAEYLKKAALDAGITLEIAPASSSSEISDAANSLVLSKGCEIICQIADNLTAAAFQAVVRPADNALVPVFGFIDDNVKNGAAISYARDYRQGGKDSAKMALRILNGENPAGIPFEYISKTTLSINKKAAKRNKLNLPEAVIKRAQTVIE